MALSDLCPEVIVFDDASTPAVADQIGSWTLRPSLRTIRDDGAPGYIAGRNRLVQEAGAPVVLLMDDDAAVLEGEAIRGALQLLEADASVGAIAFAQCDAAGKPWQEGMQPARSQMACRVPAFIGFAHLVKRDVFQAIGGYRETFEFYGEEKDFCLRLIDAGYQTIYLPDALVIHEPDRDEKRLPDSALQRALHSAHLALACAVRALLPHEARLADPGSTGVALDSQRTGRACQRRDSRPRAGFARHDRDLEAAPRIAGTLRPPTS